LLNRNETSIEESSFSVIIKASLSAEESHVRLANHMTILPLLLGDFRFEYENESEYENIFFQL